MVVSWSFCKFQEGLDSDGKLIMSCVKTLFRMNERKIRGLKQGKSCCVGLYMEFYMHGSQYLNNY